MRDSPLHPRSILAPNPSAMTLDGTRTFVIGRTRALVIDPGPADAAHLAAIRARVAGAQNSTVVLTHDHPDHSAGAEQLAAALGADIRAAAHGTLADGDVLESDAGALIAVATPGHTRDHFAFWWQAASAVFVGDLMLGGSDTAFVGSPEGDLGAYLRSLERVRDLAARRLFPAHGPPFEDPAAAIDRYRLHREERVEQVRAALAAIGVEAAKVGAPVVDGIVDRVYGASLDPALRDVARMAVRAYVDHIADRAAG